MYTASGSKVFSQYRVGQTPRSAADAHVRLTVVGATLRQRVQGPVFRLRTCTVLPRAANGWRKWPPNPIAIAILQPLGGSCYDLHKQREGLLCTCENYAY